MPIPLPGDFPEFCQPYIDRAQADDFDALCQQAEADMQSILQIPFSKSGWSYAPGKWTVNEVLQHLIDTERIYSYRALVIARGEPKVLHTVDELEYTRQAAANNRTLASLLEELLAVRRATDILFLNLTDEQLQRRGLVGDDDYTVNSLGYYVYGHLNHHQQMLMERYGL